MRFTTTIEIAAPIENVWPVMIEVEQWPHWTPTMTTVTRLDDGPLRLGCLTRVVQPKLPAATYRVTELTPGESFTWANRRFGVTGTASHYLKPAPGGGTKVTLGIDLTGPLSPLVSKLSGKLIQEYIDTEARELARQVTSA